MIYLYPTYVPAALDESMNIKVAKERPIKVTAFMRDFGSFCLKKRSIII